MWGQNSSVVIAIQRFAKLSESTVSVVVFSRSSDRVGQLDSHWMDFDEI